MTEDPDAQIRARLRMIAETLNLPTEYFYIEPTTPGSVADANECLRLWSRIRTPEGRRRALEILRALGDDGEP
ncbi:MAG: hypothetical protein Q7T93_16320 [Methylobacterium sp.]|jgi:hypothetical protein|uniref:hypothetical protein n=1 Tax=unclassified Methylobacterium TaxID=2615210 RepID=UPI000AF1EE49|nr:MULTISPECIES: hypothetical protein [unclassified Methylobacterium]MDO9428383.1 hypothetical protein [Methylobacterium sp.]TXM72721.1 hypothetical protein FV218_12725 [Methylobacterium sp. WL69]